MKLHYKMVTTKGMILTIRKFLLLGIIMKRD